MEIETPRLRMVASTPMLAEAELASPERLAELLGCAAPSDWPPPLNDADSMSWNLQFLHRNPEGSGWSMWYFIAGKELIGNGGFKGEPADGLVEIGYSVLPRFQKMGFATEAVNALVVWAFAHDGVDRVIAHTYPDLQASVGVLQKNGFRCAGEGAEPGTICFELARPHGLAELPEWLRCL